MTLTTDRFNEIYENPEQCSYSEIQEMAAMLANWEAQPVAYTEQCEISNMQATGLYLRGFPDNSQGRNIPLYTAPPAPAVPVEIRNAYRAEGLAEVLKDAREYAPLTAEQWGTLVKNWHQTFIGLSGDANACRAAMLAQPVSSGCMLPDGWKLVPVEPTEEMLRAAYREAAVYSPTAYRAMLAAAPDVGN
ncbi:TPA: hypothetical protein ACXJS2_001727 [Serratia marcescens]